MQTIKNERLTARKVIYGIMMAMALLIALSAWDTPDARAQNDFGDALAGPSVNLSAEAETFGSGEEVVVHVTITNPTTSPVHMLRWLTPSDGIEGSLFNVTQDGNPVAYRGKLVKRTAPTEADYITLLPGESMASDVNLADYYDFSTSGGYQVSYNVASPELYTNGDRQLLKSTDNLASNTLELFVEGRAYSETHEVTPLAVSGTNGFTGCSASQQADLISARNAASSYAANAVAYFNANRQGARYTTWFGVYDASRYSLAGSHFSAVRNAVDTASPMNFDCTCTDSGVYAYVYPDSPYNIYLCGAFWNAPMTGTDSKAGTLIHELTHFYAVASTQDYAYGQAAAKALAISNPANAVMNADNHEYFAEDNPPSEPPTSTCTDSGNGPLFTTQDNQNNAGTGVGDCDLDTYLFNTSPIQPIEFTINVPAGTSVSSAGLLLQQWDVDETSGEVDKVYFNGNYAGTLTGANDTWSTTFLTLNPSWVVAGENLVRIDIDVMNVDVWAVQTNWGQLLLNGDAQGTATIATTSLDQTTYNSGGIVHVDLGIDTILPSQSVHVEVNLRDPMGVILDGVVVDQILSAKGVSGNSVAPVAVDLDIPTEGPTGRYDIQILIYDAGTNLIQDYVIVPFDLNGTYTFYDVPSSNWAWSWIERLYDASITGGCGTNPLVYCPEASVTRAQMAIFILRGEHGAAYNPPAATGTVFGDVSTSTFAAAWIEQFASEGITGGCGGGNYCPNDYVTRAQMAIFLLRGKYGSAYTPPAATGTVFSDVPVGSFAADWIEQLAAEGVTAGCGGGKYCPNASVTRAEMAVFLVRTFNLP